MTGTAWRVGLPDDRFLVVGGGSGIGRGVAVALAGLGKTVYVAGRREPRLQETADLARPGPGRVIPMACDIQNQASVDRMFRIIEDDGGPIPALVNSAASATYSPAKELTNEVFEDTIGWSLIGGFRLLHRWGTSLLLRGLPGCAVTLTSGFADRGCPGVAHSSAGKAGLESLSRALGREWGPHGLRLNAVGVGAFPVEKSQDMWSESEIRERMLDQIALGRFGRLPEIVGPILFLLSDAASFITGHVLYVEGGVRIPPWPLLPEKIGAGYNNQYEVSVDRDEPQIGPAA